MLLHRIGTHGPIGFDEFMETALYHPELGFYTRGRGPGPDFVTSPVISPLFGALLARAVAATHAALGGPSPFTLCEVGAGSGRLMVDVLGAAVDRTDRWLETADVVLVEKAAPMPEPAPPGFRFVTGLDMVEPFAGFLFANEVLDNLPVRLWAESGTEVRVGERAGRLALVPEADGYRVEPVGTRAFVEQVGRALVLGVAVLIDYGGSGVRTFVAHELGEDLLADPGERDVTCSVDWDDVAEQAEQVGLAVLARQTQRELLLELGLDSTVRALRAAELAAVQEQDTWGSLRFRDQRTRAAALAAPDGPGGFDVMVLGRRIDQVPWRAI